MDSLFPIQGNILSSFFVTYFFDFEVHEGVDDGDSNCGLN